MVRYHSTNSAAISSHENVERIAPFIGFDHVAGSYRWLDLPSKSQEKRKFKPRKGSGVVSLSDYEISQLPNCARKCVLGLYSLEMFKSGVSSGFKRAYCGSWKCPVCASWVRAVDYCRISATLKQYELSSIFYAVNTVSSTVLTNVLDINADGSYEYVYDCWKRLWDRLKYYYPDVKMVQTVERQRNKYAHLNTIFVSEQLGRDYKENPLNIASWYGKISEECGFGERFSFEPVNNVEGMSNYISKVATAGDDGSSVNQSSHIVKLSQLPLNTKKGFRRLRSSKGFLVKRWKGLGDGEVEYRFIRGHAELLNMVRDASIAHQERFKDLPPDASSDSSTETNGTNVSEPVSPAPTSSKVDECSVPQSQQLSLVEYGTSQGSDQAMRPEQVRMKLVAMYEYVGVGDIVEEVAGSGGGVVISLEEYRRKLTNLRR